MRQCRAVLVNFAFANALISPFPVPDHFVYSNPQRGPHQHHPDGVLLYDADHPALPQLPLVMVEVEVLHRSVPELITLATEYLQRLSIRCVVCFKIFPAYTGRRGLCRRLHALVKKPALAVVFERIPGQRGHPYSIRIVQEISFGTAPIHDTVQTRLSQLPTPTLAGNPLNPRVHVSPNQRHDVDPLNVRASFATMAPQNLVVQIRNDPNAQVLPNIQFDLSALLQMALVGWREDHA